MKQGDYKVRIIPLPLLQNRPYTLHALTYSGPLPPTDPPLALSFFATPAPRTALSVSLALGLVVSAPRLSGFPVALPDFLAELHLSLSLLSLVHLKKKKHL